MVGTKHPVASVAEKGRAETGVDFHDMDEGAVSIEYFNDNLVWIVEPNEWWEFTFSLFSKFCVVKSNSFSSPGSILA